MRSPSASPSARWRPTLNRLDFRLKGPSYFLLITTMIVPVQIILIPLLPWFQTLNLTGDASQYVGIILVHVAVGAGSAVFMLGGFMAEIPEELLEAAQIDGASHFGVFRAVVLPLSLPGIMPFGSSTSCSCGMICCLP